jgi:hypothetical protein
VKSARVGAHEFAWRKGQQHCNRLRNQVGRPGFRFRLFREGACRKSCCRTLRPRDWPAFSPAKVLLVQRISATVEQVDLAQHAVNMRVVAERAENAERLMQPVDCDPCRQRNR